MEGSGFDPRSIELPPTIEKKDYQLDALAGVAAAWEKGYTAPLLAMPTGTGKTITSGLVAKYALEQLERKVLFVAHRTVLIEQATNTFQKAFGFATAVEMAASSEKEYVERHGSEPEVVVATVQSLHEGRLLSAYRQDRFGLVIVDEAHRATAASYRAVLSHFPHAFRLGITATPDGATGKLGGVFDVIAYQMRLRDAIEGGHLVPIHVRRIEVPVDLRAITTTGDDYNVGDLAARLSPAIETLAYQIHHNIGERQTVVFTPDVGSAQMVAAMLQKMGRPAEYVAGTGGKFGMSKEDRQERLRQYKAHKFQVISCCDLLVEGWDMPAVACVVVARPTKKRSRYVQMVGRGTRICYEIGKTNCLVLDLDWQQDRSSRQLCRAHTLFCDEGASDEALEALTHRIANKKSGEPREDTDVFRELQEIESEIRRRGTQIEVQYTGKHTQLYQAVDSSPFGVGKVLDIRVRKSKDFDPYHCGPATPNQVFTLESFGVSGAAQMNLWGAGRLISVLKKRENHGLAYQQQVKKLLESGVSEQQARSASVHDAAAMIAQIVAKTGGQGRLF